MLAAIAAAFLVSLGAGHIGQRPVITQHAGHQLQAAIPARSYLTDESTCRQLKPLGVEIYYAHQRYQMVRPTSWTDDHSIAHYGPVTFNGVTFSNTSRTAWANVDATIYQAC